MPASSSFSLWPFPRGGEAWPAPGSLVLVLFRLVRLALLLVLRLALLLIRIVLLLLFRLRLLELLQRFPLLVRQDRQLLRADLLHQLCLVLVDGHQLSPLLLRHLQRFLVRLVQFLPLLPIVL